MSNKDPIVFLNHILESIHKIERISEGTNRRELEKDEIRQNALVRLIEIIGEAVKNLSIGFTANYPRVQWTEIARMRDKLIHQYFDVDLDIVWKVIKEDLPVLKKEIKITLEKEKKHEK